MPRDSAPNRGESPVLGCFRKTTGGWRWVLSAKRRWLLAGSVGLALGLADAMMSRKLFMILVVGAAVSVGLSSLAFSDFQDGLTAFQRRDYGTAFKELRPLAEKGESLAQFYLGVMYEDGRGVTRDYGTALMWYRKAAEQGQVKAQNNLGGMYYGGWGVTRDYGTAVKWYRKVADQGDALAQYFLGVMYDSGRGLTQDYKEAVKWFRMAAERGNVSAQYNLGEMYAKGQGVTQDYVQSDMWFNIGAKNGYEKARKYRDIVEKILTATDISKARKLAEEWMAKHRK